MVVEISGNYEVVSILVMTQMLRLKVLPTRAGLAGQLLLGGQVLGRLGLASLLQSWLEDILGGVDAKIIRLIRRLCQTASLCHEVRIDLAHLLEILKQQEDCTL